MKKEEISQSSSFAHLGDERVKIKAKIVMTMRRKGRIHTFEEEEEEEARRRKTSSV